MTLWMEKLEGQVWYDKLYFVSVACKDLNGFVELVAGIWLLLNPHSLHALLQFLFGHAVQHPGHFMQFIAEHITHIDASLAAGGIIVVALFSLSHGIVKLTMVYALLKELLWAYPYALAVLTSFWFYQIYLFIKHPTIWMFLFCALDVVVLFMVYGEWQKQKRKRGAK